MIQTVEEAPTEPAALYALLAAMPHSVGELVDFAQSVPPAWIEPMIEALQWGVRDKSNRPSRLRKLVILGILTERLIFEVERLPKSRSAII